MARHHTVALALACLIAAPAAACWECVYQILGIRWTPAVLAKMERGMRVRIQQVAAPYDLADITFAGNQQTFVKPADQERVKRAHTARAIASAACRQRVPYEQLDPAAAIALRPHLRVGNTAHEEVGPCIEVNGTLWFGLTFYEGEGEDGVGGVGMFDPATKKLEIRRPQWLRDKSVDTLAYDGRNLWLTVSQHYEKSGVSWGLVRYDWSRDAIEPLTGDDAPCGLAAFDVLLDGTTLWVTTESALSQLDLTTNRWSHFVLQRNGSRFDPADCHRVYKRLLDVVVPHFAAGSECSTVCEEDELQIPEQIARLDPQVVRDYFDAHPVNPHNFASLHAIGVASRNFADLKRLAIDRVKDPDWLKYALDRFTAKRSRERAWRDFALQWARKTGAIEQLRYFRGDEAVFDVLVPIAQGNSRNAYAAAEMLPWIDSTRAIPVLLNIVSAQSETAQGFNERMTYEHALEALEHAAHLRIEADGSRTPLPANSDTPEYSDEEFGAFLRNASRDAEGMKKIVAQWKAWAIERGRGR